MKKVQSYFYFLITVFIIFQYTYLPAEINLKELNTGFNYSEWYKSETGYNPDSLWFGAWVIAPHDDKVYLGFGTSIPANLDGAILACWDSDSMSLLGKFSEQGIHCIKWVEDTLFGIGSDPSIGDGWDGGNFYKYFPSTGEFVKLRYDSNKKPILPRVLHSWGISFDSLTNIFYLATSSYEPSQYSKNGSKCGNLEDSTLACFGQVWQSIDFGNSWELLNGRNPYEISPFRTMDVIPFHGNLYATNDNNGYYTSNLKISTDDGISWDIFPDVYPYSFNRMCVFQNKLILSDNDLSSLYIIDENNLIKTLYLSSRLNFSFNNFAVADDRFLVVFFIDGSVYYTSDLYQWNNLIPATGRNFLSIAYWEKDKSIVLAERGINGSIWKVDITELLSTEVIEDTNQEIKFNIFNNSIFLSSKYNEFYLVNIIDVLGNIITVPVLISSDYTRIDFSKLSSGIYFVVINTSSSVIIRKIIKY